MINANDNIYLFWNTGNSEITNSLPNREAVIYYNSPILPRPSGKKTYLRTPPPHPLGNYLLLDPPPAPPLGISFALREGMDIFWNYTM